MEKITNNYLHGNDPEQSVGGNRLNSASSIYFGRLVILFALLLSLSALNSHSQLTPGITIGYNHAIFAGPDAKAWGFLDADPMYASRFLIGAFIMKSMTDNLFAESGLSLSTRGTLYKNEREIYNMETNQMSLEEIRLQKRLAYLSIPLTMRYYLTSNFNLAFGPELSLLLLAKAIRSEGDRDPIKTNVLEEYHRLDLALRLAACYYLTNSLYIQLGYLYGLSDIVKYESYSSYLVKNMLIQFSLGFVLNGR